MFSAQIGYDFNGLEPFLSSETLAYHYGKHHSGYADNLNMLIQNTKYASMTLKDIIVQSRRCSDQKIFNNAAQLFNHDFYWKCMSNDNVSPSDKFLAKINSEFGNLEKFQNEYINFANSLFGSGWSWLVLEDDHLKFVNTSNAENVVGCDVVPLCVIDLWEHAYYIDYKNRRGDYIADFVKNHINWAFCETQI